MKTEVLCIGQAVVDCITRGVEDDPFGRGKTRAQSITLNLGGDAVNESFVLSSLGRRAGLMCAVGNDLAGRFVINEASRRGLDISGVTTAAGIATPVANMFVKMDGSRSSVTSAASLLPGAKYTPDKVKPTREKETESETETEKEKESSTEPEGSVCRTKDVRRTLPA